MTQDIKWNLFLVKAVVKQHETRTESTPESRTHFGTVALVCHLWVVLVKDLDDSCCHQLQYHGSHLHISSSLVSTHEVSERLFVVHKLDPVFEKIRGCPLVFGWGTYSRLLRSEFFKFYMELLIETGVWRLTTKSIVLRNSAYAVYRKVKVGIKLFLNTYYILFD